MPCVSPALGLATGSSFLMAVLDVALSVFSIINAASELKIAGVIIAANAIGAMLFMFAERRRTKSLA